MKALKLKRSFKNTLSHDTRAVDEEKSNGKDNNKNIPLITDDEIQEAINKLKKVKPVTLMESGPKTSRTVTLPRKKR